MYTKVKLFFFVEISASSVSVVAWRVIYACDDRDRQREMERKFH